MALGWKQKTSSTAPGVDTAVCHPFQSTCLCSGSESEPQVTELGVMQGKAHPISLFPSGQCSAIRFLLGKVRGNIFFISRLKVQSEPIPTNSRHFRLGIIQMGVHLKFIFAVLTQKDLKKQVDTLNKNNYNISGDKV